MLRPSPPNTPHESCAGRAGVFYPTAQGCQGRGRRVLRVAPFSPPSEMQLSCSRHRTEQNAPRQSQAREAHPGTALESPALGAPKGHRHRAWRFSARSPGHTPNPQVPKGRRPQPARPAELWPIRRTGIPARFRPRSSRNEYVQTSDCPAIPLRRRQPAFRLSNLYKHPGHPLRKAMSIGCSFPPRNSASPKQFEERTLWV